MNFHDLRRSTMPIAERRHVTHYWVLLRILVVSSVGDAGFDNIFTLVCTGGSLTADTSPCSVRGCSKASTAVAALLGETGK